MSDQAPGDDRGPAAELIGAARRVSDQAKTPGADPDRLQAQLGHLDERTAALPAEQQAAVRWELTGARLAVQALLMQQAGADDPLVRFTDARRRGLAERRRGADEHADQLAEDPDRR